VIIKPRTASASKLGSAEVAVGIANLTTWLATTEADKEESKFKSAHEATLAVS
jgi:hypothetical protein